MTWAPRLPPNASWHDIARLQLLPWRASGIDVQALLAQTDGLRRRPGAAPAAAYVDTATWQIQRLGKWVGHHSVRAQAALNIFRHVQRRAAAAARPLPHIRFVLIVSDGHGTVTPEFNLSCSCTRPDTCCEPPDGTATAGLTPPPAPTFATLHCRHSWDVSVPTIIDDLMDTSTVASMSRGVDKWLNLGNTQPWASREARAFFVGDQKAYRPNVIATGRALPHHFAVHEAVSTNKAARLPFDRHVAYKAAVYAHGFHFNSVRWRRLSLLGGVVVAQEAPCKEWWSLLARPWVHYAPTAATFSDLAHVAAKVLDPATDAEARAMAAAMKQLGLRAFRPSGLLDYVEALWTQYAALQRGRRSDARSDARSPRREEPVPQRHDEAARPRPLASSAHPPSLQSARHGVRLAPVARANTHGITPAAKWALGGPRRVSGAPAVPTARVKMKPPPQPAANRHGQAAPAGSSARTSIQEPSQPSASQPKAATRAMPRYWTERNNALRHIRPSWSVEHAVF